MTSKKLIASVLAFAMAVAIMPGVGQAATAEELAAQIAALQAQLAALQAQLGQTTGGTGTSVAACSGITFTRNLTLGSTGADVQCLQALLNQDADTMVAATGVGSAGNETQYFGGLTKTAVIKFQNKYAAEVLAPIGLTTGTGFVGSMTRAKLNAMLTTGVTPTTPTGETGVTPTTPTTTTTGLTQTGAEGAITVSINPSPADGVKLYEGDAKKDIYALKIKATGSDVDVQRVTLRFNSLPYSYFTTVYLYDGDTELVSSPLNSSTVSKVSSTDYEITLAGFTNRAIITKDATKVITVKVDVLAGISSSLLTSGVATILVGTPSSTSVRAVDQAGLNQYGGVAYTAGTSTTYRTFTVNQSQSANATLTVSANASTPKARNLIGDSSQLITGATLLTFDVKATKDDLLVDNISNVLFAAGGYVPTTSSTYTQTGVAKASGSTDYIVPTTAYLVDDTGTVIGTATPSGNSGTTIAAASFSDLNYTIPKDTTKTFSIKIDDTLSTYSSPTSADDGLKYQAAVYAGQITGTKSNGASITGTASVANGYDAIVYAEGPVFTLARISTSSSQAAVTSASSTITATFDIQVAANTGDVWIPDDHAFTIDYGVSGTDTAAITDITYVQPSGTVDGTQGYKVAQGNTATFAVTGTTAGVGATYDLRIMAIKWGHTDIAYNAAGIITSNYMANNSNWISQAVYLH